MLISFSDLTEEERLHGVFKQNTATAHMTYASLEALHKVFSDHVISRDLWPSCSHDLTPCVLHLSGRLKGKVYKANSHTPDEPRNNIHHAISTISGEELRRVTAMFHGYAECIWSGRQHF